jgi:RNA polymerase sigma-70 factor (ECF subfamily)
MKAPAEEETVDFETLYRTHARQVWRWAARLGGPTVEADDVVQEVFVIARRRLSRFAGQAKVTTWLFRTTEKVVRNARRKLRWRRWLGLPQPEIASPRPTPVEALERDELVRQVHAVLEDLPERHRRMLILFEMEGLSTDEIAALVGARVGTIRVWLHRARAAFIAAQQRRGFVFSNDHGGLK